MMTFANYRSPVLLEVLADLLLHTNSHRGAGNLASRAYLKASWETEGEVADAYFEKAKWGREHGFQFLPDGMIDRPEKIDKKALVVDTIKNKEMFTPAIKMEDLKTALKYEIQLAEIWFDSVRVNEMSWIKQGLNPDSAFAKTYYEKELQNKAVHMFGASQIKDKVRNDIWSFTTTNKTSLI